MVIVQNKKNYDSLRNSIIDHIDNGIAFNENLLKEHYKTIINEPNSNREFFAFRIAKSLYSQGNLKESLECFIEALKHSPNSLFLNLNYRDHLTEVTLALEVMWIQEPKSFQLRTLYEFLAELGALSMKCHLLAVDHYRQTDSQERAKEILKSLHLIMPNYHGLLKIEEIV